MYKLWKLFVLIPYILTINVNKTKNARNKMTKKKIPKEGEKIQISTLRENMNVNE